MGKYNRKTTESQFYCTQCGKRGIPIQRVSGQQRERGHLKKLYCLYCKEETNHAEVREIGGYTYEDFLEEFEAGRFVDGKRVGQEELTSCSNNECPFNKNGKCWNADDSAQCPLKPKRGID